MYSTGTTIVPACILHEWLLSQSRIPVAKSQSLRFLSDCKQKKGREKKNECTANVRATEVEEISQGEGQ
jgi:hypothetical protein